MTLFPHRRTLLHTVALALSLAIFMSATGCSAESRARRSLNRMVYKEIKQFNKYNVREEKPRIYKSGARFYRIYKERVDPTVNMRRTNSIDTPYIATLVFTENLYLTHRHDTMEDSLKDSHFILSNSAKREILYTYAQGTWRKKETN